MADPRRAKMLSSALRRIGLEEAMGNGPKMKTAEHSSVAESWSCAGLFPKHSGVRGWWAAHAYQLLSERLGGTCMN